VAPASNETKTNVRIATMAVYFPLYVPGGYDFTPAMRPDRRVTCGAWIAFTRTG
jgi:hypothetical protein